MADIVQIVTGVILSLLTVGLFSIAITDHSSKYDTTLSTEINTSINTFNTQFDDSTDIATDSYNITSTTEASQTVDSGVDPKKALSAVKTSISNVITVTLAMAGSLGGIFMIPDIAFQALMMITVFTMAVILWALVFKIKP